MAQTISNPRFPHFCVIRRFSEVDSFTPDNPFEPENLDNDGFPVKEEKETVIYADMCRRESSDNIRTFKTGSTSIGQVFYGDYRVSIPGRIEIQEGDIVNVDFIIGKDKDAVVIHPNYSSLKTKKYPDGCTEFYYNKASI